jgi:acyl-CoA synthetase (AMP-forming)/AMP-acid ligase II
VPRRIELRSESLPKSAAGEILKRDLRDPYRVGRQAQIEGS